MPERGKSPEIYFSPEHWDGHLLDGSCCRDKTSRNISSSRPKISILGSFMKNIKARRLADRTYRDLRGLMDIEQETVIRRYTQGDLFNAESYAEGTVLHVQGEVLDGRFLFIPQYYADRTYYGYLNRSFKFQTDQSPFIIYFQAILFPQRTVLLNMPTIAFSPIQVGEVKHTLTGLRRINKIDVVGLGLFQTQGVDHQKEPMTSIPELSPI